MKLTKMMTASAAVLAAVISQAAPIKFVSHAGDQFSAPGHSIPAYKVAIERKADFLKLDLNLTRDGVIVMMHDRTTNRKMDRKMVIAEHDYRELYENCTYKPVEGFDKEKIVRLEQTLEMVRDAPISLWLDMKGFDPKTPERSMLLVDSAMSAVRKYGIADGRLMAATWSQPALRYMKKKYPEIRRVFHISMRSRNGMCQLNTEADPAKQLMKPEMILPSLLAKAEELELYGFNIPITSPFFSRELVQALKAKGYWVSVWFVQNAETAEKAVEAGADAMVTDHLKVVQPAVKKKMTAAAAPKK